MTDVSRHVPDKTKLMLAVLAGGRCEHCNAFLFEHYLTKRGGVFGENAHIIGFSERGPRGRDPDRPSDVHAIENLMLLCHPCHKLVDDNDDDYPTSELIAGKRKHEARIRTVTGVATHRVTNMLMYGAKVGTHDSRLTAKDARSALLPERYPASAEGLVVGMANGVWTDAKTDYWEIQERQLRGMFQELVRPLLRNGEQRHFSVLRLRHSLC